MKISGLLFCSFIFCVLILLTIHYYIILHLYFIPRLEAVSYERRQRTIYSQGQEQFNTEHRFNDQELLSYKKGHRSHSKSSSISDSRGKIKHGQDSQTENPSVQAYSPDVSKEPSSSSSNGQQGLLLNNSSPLETLSSIQVTQTHSVTTSVSGMSVDKSYYSIHQYLFSKSDGSKSSLSMSTVSNPVKSNQMTIQDVKRFKEQVMKDLKNWEIESTNILYHPSSRSNKYNVKHVKKLTGISDPNPDNFCNSIKLATIDGSFPGIISRGVYGALTGQSLSNAIRERVMAKLEPNNSIQNKRLLSSSLNCGLVTNSGALKGSRNGEDIDTNDLVLRFNDAPTGRRSSDGNQNIDPLTTDVGSVSDIRIINSKVLSDPHFNASSKTFHNQILIVWDPYQYMTFDPSFDMNLIAGNFEGRNPKMDHDFYESFIRIKEQNPNIKMYILDPRTVWDSWKLLQETTSRRIPKTPPSSGFLGLVLLSKFCSTVTMYEYIPSIRVTDTCHYYDEEKSGHKNTGGVGPGCTYGDWHPLSSEKLFSLRLNYASDSDVFIGGRIKLAGCSNGWPQNLIKSFNMWSSNKLG